MIDVVNSQALASSVSSNRTEKPDTEPLSKQPARGDRGDLGVDDLQAAVVKISAEGASRAAAGGQTAPSAPGVLASVDSDGDGKATEHEFRDGAPRAPQTRVAGDPGRASAAPAGGSAGGSGGSSAISSSAQTYDPADANEDGTVSAQEQQAYGARLAADKAAQSAASSSRAAGADAAVKAYAAVEQLSQDSRAAAA